jgi:carbohydrate kinase (thermoresistant glucokinase family)
MILVLMGVSGAGKTTIGTLLARRTGAVFADADDYHSAANKAKMAGGTALTDEDRRPWLETLNGLMRGWFAEGKFGVLACSALKASYRQTLGAGMPEGAVRFVFLDASRGVIAERLAERHHEYMNPALLESQMKTIEPPEAGIRVENDLAPDAVVVGGTSGIGLAMAVGLAEAGAEVVATSRRQEQVDEAAGKVEAAYAGDGRRTLRLASDVGDRASLQALCDAVLKEFGKVDILVNCAGRIKREPTLSVTEETWDGIMDTNVTGTLRACQVFGKPMLERGSGKIVNIASLNTFVSLKEVAAYAASKAAVGALTKSLAVEWSAQGVNVNAIAPGVFRTALNQKLLDESERGHELRLRTPMGRFGRTEELVGAAIFLASDAASFVTGEILVVDGGFLASGVNQ